MPRYTTMIHMEHSRCSFQRCRHHTQRASQDIGQTRCREELGNRLAELDRNTTMSLLAAEAAFRIDYLQRCYQRKKDWVSRQVSGNLQREKGSRVSLEDEIFEVWKSNTSGSNKLISDLRGAFKFRHWMAHGRYWTPKLGQKYDYLSI